MSSVQPSARLEFTTLNQDLGWDQESLFNQLSHWSPPLHNSVLENKVPLPMMKKEYLETDVVVEAS